MEEQDYCSQCERYEDAISTLEDKLGMFENEIDELKRENERLKEILNDIEIAASKA